MAESDRKQGTQDANQNKGPQNPNTFKNDPARKDYETGYNQGKNQGKTK
jgi:hypothetical protein